VIVVRRDMISNSGTPPIVPVDEGNLRASFFTVTSTGAVKAGSSPTFKGKQAAKLSAQHGPVVEEAAGMTKGISNKYKPMVTFGFTAEYAAWVHENMEATNWQRPGSGPKFMEASIKRNHAKIIGEIREAAKVR